VEVGFSVLIAIYLDNNVLVSISDEVSAVVLDIGTSTTRAGFVPSFVLGRDRELAL
jgi:hypothetical protein